MDTPAREPAKEPAPPPGGAPSDRDLVEQARGGDTAAFTRLVERHERQIYRLALRLTGNESDAEEVLQEAFLNAWEKLGEFRGDAAFNSWIYRIASNCALMRLRRRRRAPDVPVVEERTSEELPGPQFGEDGGYLHPPRSDWSMRADEALHNRQLGGAIEAAVANLSEDYRVVFMLKDVDGLSNEEIADALGLTVPAVKSRLHRARLALREQLGGYFGER